MEPFIVLLIIWGVIGALTKQKKFDTSDKSSEKTSSPSGRRPSQGSTLRDLRRQIEASMRELGNESSKETKERIPYASPQEKRPDPVSVRSTRSEINQKRRMTEADRRRLESLKKQQAVKSAAAPQELHVSSDYDPWPKGHERHNGYCEEDQDIYYEGSPDRVIGSSDEAWEGDILNEEHVVFNAEMLVKGMVIKEILDKPLAYRHYR